MEEQNVENPPGPPQLQIEDDDDHSKDSKERKNQVEVDKSPTPTTGSDSSPLVSSHPTNPQEEDLDTETKEKIKGDAIGNTLYSARFVLKTLMELKQQNGKNIEESFEKDMELLWVRILK